MAPRRREPSARRKIRLATFGTVVGIVTSFVTIALGAFDLRDKVDSVDASDRVAVSASYVQELGDVCGERDEAQETRRRDAFELKRRIRAAARFPQQRLIVLEFVNRELARGDYTLAKFAGIVAPPEVSKEHTRVRKLWEGIGDRLRRHRDRIEASVSRAGLVNVLDRLNRSLAETQARDVDAGLRRLGQGSCHIGPPPALPVVNLPHDPSGTPGLDLVPGPSDSEPDPADPHTTTGSALSSGGEPEVAPEQPTESGTDVRPPQYAVPPEAERPDARPPAYRVPSAGLAAP